ncbi:MAG: PhoH family protein [Eubacteriales bacterium]
MAQRLINVGDNNIVSAIFGELDATASFIEKEYGVTLTNRDNHIRISSDDEEKVRLAANVIDYLIGVVNVNETLTEQNVRYAMCMVNDGNYGELAQLDQDCICITFKGKPIKAKTIGQRKYVEAIKKNTIVFGIGPAGTGKTFLAVAMAVTALRQKTVDRIILTRPAVEAGERLGFLPGDLQSKIDPYLRPLYDALFEMMGYEGYQKNVEKGIIEIAPLAYMRGRTLDNAFIILDEAQNTTAEQMKMFLTRLGFGSRAVVTGDITQVDLPEGKRSGLVEASRILRGIEQINIHSFTEKDVVRHALVQKIIVAYDKYETERNKKREKEHQQ